MTTNRQRRSSQTAAQALGAPGLHAPGLGAAGAGRAQRAHAHQQPHAVTGTEGRGGNDHGVAVAGQPGMDLGRSAGAACTQQQFAHRPARGRVERLQRRLAAQRRAMRQQLGRGGVGFDDEQRERVHHQHGVGGHLHQQVVVTLGLARLPVAALQFLLRVVEALLDGGDGAQVGLPDR